MIEKDHCLTLWTLPCGRPDDDLAGWLLKERWETMMQPNKVVIERDAQGGYVATFPGLASRQTQAWSLKALMECIQEAMAHSPEVDQLAAVPRETVGGAPDG
jgi:hypothetical protein